MLVSTICIAVLAMMPIAVARFALRSAMAVFVLGEIGMVIPVMLVAVVCIRVVAMRPIATMCVGMWPVMRRATGLMSRPGGGRRGPVMETT
jgi:hypothetical protein